MSAANVAFRYLFDHHLSHSLHLEPPLPTLPELELTLDIAYIARLIYLTPSGFAYFNRQEIAHQEYISCTSTRDLLSHISELPPELHLCWEESISSYVCEAMKGVKVGRLQVVVKVEIIGETTTTDEDDWAEELVLERNKEEYAVPRVMIESSLEEIMAEDCDNESNCAVCLEEFELSKSEKRIVRILRCSHVFHRECVLEWLVSHPSCPLCRSEISGLLKIKMLMVVMYNYFLMLILASILE